MPIINLEQGSAIWLAFRKQRIMATDIPVVLDVNPWKTKLELFEEKLDIRPPIELNDAMRRGMMLEDPARALASSLIGIKFYPTVIESAEFPWLAASLDGLSSCSKYILEIKCPNAGTHEEAIDNRIPIYYQYQIQTQLLVSDADIAYYFSYRPECKEKDYAIVEVYPDHEKWAEIIEKGYEFYVQMCTMQRPEEWKLKVRK